MEASFELAILLLQPPTYLVFMHMPPDPTRKVIVLPRVCVWCSACVWKIVCMCVGVCVYEVLHLYGPTVDIGFLSEPLSTLLV